MTYLFRIVLILVLLGAGLGTNARTINVLFLGNSYTYSNDMPSMLEELALEDGDTVYTQRSTPGGYTLWQHLNSQNSIGMIEEGIWDFVVLQEQSQYPTIPYYRDNFTFPAADSLNKLIKEHNPCATAVFFMTWGRKYGGQQCIGNHCSPDFVDFFHMQDSLESAYMHMAHENDAFCSPVGISWSNSIANGDPINLFTADNSHPSLAGSYLAACTFYATILNKSPVDLSYTAGLSASDAQYLQQVADFTVRTDPGSWNIIYPDPVEAYFTYDLESNLANFYNGSSTATSYYWDFGDPASGSHNNSTLENPSHTFSGPGTFLVSLVAIHECLEPDMFVDTLEIIETGIAEPKEFRVSLYPNPADELIQIKSDVAFRGYMIRDINGKTCLTGKLYQSTNKIITASLPAGIYYIELRGTAIRYSQKIIIR